MWLRTAVGWRVSQREYGLGDEMQPVGSDYQYDDGLHVRVDDVVPYELVDPEDSDGYRQGDDLVRCTLYLSNGTAHPIDVDGITLLVRGGPYGKTARKVRDYRTELLDDGLEGTLRKGRRASATWAYSIPAGTVGELDIEVRSRMTTSARASPSPRREPQRPQAQDDCRTRHRCSANSNRPCSPAPTTPFPHAATAKRPVPCSQPYRHSPRGRTPA